MKITVVFITVVCSLSLVPKKSLSLSEVQSMNAEPLRLTLSKIAPLEEWNLEWAKSGPRVCWQFFRPTPQQLKELERTISSFQGHTRWYLTDNCLVAGSGPAFLAVPALSQGISEMPSLLSAPHLQLSREQATDDILRLARLIEDRLDLKNAEPKSFSQDLLSKEGLLRSRRLFEDFQDGGQRIVYLIVEPASSEIFEPTNADLMLHFEPSDDETTAIFNEILGVDLTQGYSRALTDLEAEKIKKEFPVLWKISDYYEDAYLGPHEVQLLLQECATLDKIASSQKAIRGLDKLFRIGRWASEKRYGVLFSAP
jgi:hypothetical protein